jgi:hypothetical protein
MMEGRPMGIDGSFKRAVCKAIGKRKLPDWVQDKNAAAAQANELVAAGNIPRLHRMEVTPAHPKGVAELILSRVPLEVVGCLDPFIEADWIQMSDRRAAFDGLAFHEQSGTPAQRCVRDELQRVLSGLLGTQCKAERIGLFIYPPMSSTSGAFGRGSSGQHFDWVRDCHSQARRVRVVVCVSASQEAKHSVHVRTLEDGVNVFRVEPLADVRAVGLMARHPAYLTCPLGNGLRSGDFFIMNAHAAGITSSIQHLVETGSSPLGVLVIDFLLPGPTEVLAAMDAAMWTDGYGLLMSPLQCCCHSNGPRVRPTWPGMLEVLQRFAGRPAQAEG